MDAQFRGKTLNWRSDTSARKSKDPKASDYSGWNVLKISGRSMAKSFVAEKSGGPAACGLALWYGEKEGIHRVSGNDRFEALRADVCDRVLGFDSRERMLKKRSRGTGDERAITLQCVAAKKGNALAWTLAGGPRARSGHQRCRNCTRKLTKYKKMMRKEWRADIFR